MANVSISISPSASKINGTISNVSVGCGLKSPVAGKKIDGYFVPEGNLIPVIIEATSLITSQTDLSAQLTETVVIPYVDMSIIMASQSNINSQLTEIIPAIEGSAVLFSQSGMNAQLTAV